MQGMNGYKLLEGLKEYILDLAYKNGSPSNYRAVLSGELLIDYLMDCH